MSLFTVIISTTFLRLSDNAALGPSPSLTMELKEGTAGWLQLSLEHGFYADPDGP